MAVGVQQAAALTLGMSDNFDAGANEGWAAGVASVNPPTVVGSGGPAGLGDGYLQVSALGGLGAGSRLTAIAGPQWTGDYLAAGITGIRMALNNPGPQDLSLRLWLAGPAGQNALSTQAVQLPAGSGWTTAMFPLLPGSLSGQALVALADVQQLRLFHATTANFPGEAIVATLGLDRVTAVPEPGRPWLWLSGLAALATLQRRRGRH